MRTLTLEAREAVAEYIMATLPRETWNGRDGWYDMAMSSCEFGCMALESLGFAIVETWGASRLDPPVLPHAMPRWDDICVVTLAILDQANEIEYRTLDGSIYEPPIRPGLLTVKTTWHVPPPKPNIAAAHKIGPARVREDRVPILEVLGLVHDGRWTEDAELVFWREQPAAWNMNVQEDPRFADALDRCLDTMPSDILETMHDLADITGTEVNLEIDRHEKALADLVARYPAQAKHQHSVTQEGALRRLTFGAKHTMEHHFLERWRLEDGWLDDDAAEAALPLFHDPLAGQMLDAAFEAMGLTFPTEVST